MNVAISPRVFHCAAPCVAGHDTTANLLAWLFVALHDNADVEARVVDALSASIAAARPSWSAVGDEPVPLEAVDGTPLLEACINETLRFHSPVPAFGRTPVSPDGEWLDGDGDGKRFWIPHGTMTLIPVWALHHHPDLWPAPEEFRPERFLKSPHGDSVSSFAFLPFSSGPRRCIGSQFALLEARVIAANVVARFRLKPVGPVHGSIGVVRRPTGGLPVHVYRR